MMAAGQLNVSQFIQQTRQVLTALLIITLVLVLGGIIWLLNGNARSLSVLYTQVAGLSVLAISAISFALYRAEQVSRLMRQLLLAQQQLQHNNAVLNSELSSRKQELDQLQNQVAEHSATESEHVAELKRLRGQVEHATSLEQAILGIYLKDRALPLEAVFSQLGANGTGMQESRRRQQILAAVNRLREAGRLEAPSMGDLSMLRLTR